VKLLSCLWLIAVAGLAL